MRECNCLTTKPENPMDKSSYYVRSGTTTRFNTAVNKNNNNNRSMTTPTFSCRRSAIKMPDALFICSLSFMLCFCVTVASAEVLPSRWQIGEQLPPSSPGIGPGTQPEVQNLLANEPNCSRWIWGQCYFNYGMCGIGKQHATRSGEGCRIIGITSRCFKKCDEALPPLPGPAIRKCIWGVDCEEEEERDYEMKQDPVPKLIPDPYPKGDREQKLPADPFQMEQPGEADDHCRWEKAPWSKCVNGMKERLRKLRANREADRGLTCPSMKRDTKTCGSKSKSKDKSSGGGNRKQTILGEKEGVNYYPKSLMPDKIPGLGPEQEYAPGDTCKWDQSVKKCGQCDPVTMEKTCTMPLLSGNPNTCGDERKGQFNCSA